MELNSEKNLRGILRRKMVLNGFRIKVEKRVGFLERYDGNSDHLENQDQKYRSLEDGQFKTENRLKLYSNRCGSG